MEVGSVGLLGMQAEPQIPFTPQAPGDGQLVVLHPPDELLEELATVHVYLPFTSVHIAPGAQFESIQQSPGIHVPGIG